MERKGCKFFFFAAKITWTTNEFATTLFEYGTASNTYTQSIPDDTYQKLYQVTLTGLTAGTTYYYRITSTDRSGNVFQDIERIIELEMFVFLPSVIR